MNDKDLLEYLMVAKVPPSDKDKDGKPIFFNRKEGDVILDCWQCNGTYRSRPY